MKTSVKVLMVLNLICYLSYLLYSYVFSIMEMKNLWVIIAFLPYFLVIISSFIVLYNDKDRVRHIKLEAIIDLILRVSALFINFYTTTLDKFSLNFKLMIVSIILLFILNILLEVLMYRKVCSYKEIEDNVKWYDISFEDRVNYNDMSKSVNRSFVEIFKLMVPITIILGINKNSSTSSILEFSIISIVLLIFYFKSSYLTLRLFYKDKAILKKVFVKESLYVVISIIMGIAFAFFRVMGYGNSDGVKFILYILQIIVLCPKFVSGNKRARKVLKIRKYKKDMLK